MGCCTTCVVETTAGAVAADGAATTICPGAGAVELPKVRVSAPKPALVGLGVAGHRNLGVGAALVDPIFHELNMPFIDSACGVNAVGDMSAQRICFVLLVA